MNPVLVHILQALGIAWSAAFLAVGAWVAAIVIRDRLGRYDIDDDPEDVAAVQRLYTEGGW